MRKSFSVHRQFGFTTIALIGFLFLYAPIFSLVVYSFNSGANIALWEGFSFRWYLQAWENERVQDAAIRSVVVAFFAAIIAASVATLAALGTTRVPNYRGKTAMYALINQPLMVPEIVTGVALLIVFAVIKEASGYTGLIYLIMAHAAFCIPFAYLPIRARLEGMDLSLETAAADLYAQPLQVFCRITLPLLGPGIIGGFMLAFVISLDDVVITELVKSAGQDTLPTYMLGQLRRSITPEINAISTVLIAISVLILTCVFLLTRKANHVQHTKGTP